MLNLKKCVSAIAKLVPAVAISATALIVASCGGGGGSGENSSALSVGPLSVNPPTANFYANVPSSFTIAGGEKPFLVSVSEPSLMPGLNGLTTRNNVMNFVPPQPGVTDLGQDPNEVPSRSVIVTVRDSAGRTATATFKVLVNYALGYGVSISSLGSNAPGDACATTLCSGLEAIVRLRPTFAGINRPGRTIKLDAVQGEYDFVTPDAAGSLVKSQTLVSDADGSITAKIRARASIPTQIAILRITDVQTSATRDEVFTISSAVSGTGIITAIPADVGVLGPDKASCATNAVFDIYVYGGKAPYTVRNPWLDIMTVTGSPVLTNGGRFTVTTTGRVCTQDAGVNLIIVDATGREITVKIVNKVGDGDPLPPFVVSPETLTIVGCGSGTLTVASSVGSPYVSVSNPTFAASPAVPVAGVPGLYSITISRVSDCTTGVTASPVNPVGQTCNAATAVATIVGGGSIKTITLTGNCPTTTTTTPAAASIAVPTTPVIINGCQQAIVTFIGQNLTSFPIATVSAQFAAQGFTVSQVSTGSSSGQLFFTVSPTSLCSPTATATAPAVACTAQTFTSGIVVTAQPGATGSGLINVSRTCNP
jgi:hypothetical protein